MPRLRTYAPGLQITRRQGQAVTITCPDGREIEIEFNRNLGKYIRLRIDAPSDFTITRNELLEGAEPCTDAPNPAA